MKNKDKKILAGMLIVFSVMLVVFIYLVNNNGEDAEITKVGETRVGQHITVSVDSPFLFSLVSDLTTGANVDISLASVQNDTDFSYSIYADEKPSFSNIVPDVILFGENYLHDIDLNVYDGKSTQTHILPASYRDRKDKLSYKNYYANPKNGYNIVEEIQKDIGFSSEIINKNFERIKNELDNIEIQYTQLDFGYNEPAIFFAGDTSNIGWIQSFNKNIRIISLYDSKTEKTSDTYNIFLAALRKYNVNKILVDMELDNNIISLLRKDLPGVQIITLQYNDLAPKLSEFYANNLNIVSQSLFDLVVPKSN